MLGRFKWAIMLGILGLGMEVAALFFLLNAFRDTGTRFFVPGEVSINIGKSGDYTLWHEAKTVIGAQSVSFPDDLPPGTTIKVVKEPDGTPVALKRGGSSHMEKSGTRRVAVGKLRLSTPGHYKVTIEGLPERRAFYLDESKFTRTLLSVVICGFFGLLLFVAAIASGIYVFIHIINARQQPLAPP